MNKYNNYLNRVAAIVRSGFNFKPTLIALLCALCLTACSVSTNDAEITVGNDITYSVGNNKPTAEALYNELIEESGLNDKDYDIYTGITINLSTIGYSSLPITTKIILEPINNRFSRVKIDRLKEIEVFKANLKQAVENLMETPSDQRRSNIARSLCYYINNLAKSKASHKKIYVMSDAIQEGGGIEFFNYIKNDKAIKEFKSQYSSISQEITKDCDVSKNTGNISIDFVYSAPPNKDHAFMAVTDFWKFHYAKLDIVVDRYPNFN